MKLFTAALFLVFTLPAFSASTYNCVAGKQTTINFSAKIESNQITVLFQNANTPDVAADLNTKSVALSFASERSSQAEGWKYFTGKAEVIKSLHDFRHFEMGISPKTPVGSAVLAGNFAMSPRGMEQWPAYMSQYDLNCKLAK